LNYLTGTQVSRTYAELVAEKLITGMNLEGPDLNLFDSQIPTITKMETKAISGATEAERIAVRCTEIMAYIRNHTIVTKSEVVLDPVIKSTSSISQNTYSI
jgi:hypothetical protein